MSSPANSLGRVAYAGYCRSSGGVSLVSGATLPAYENLPDHIQQAWEAAALAVRADAMPDANGGSAWIGVDFDGTLAKYGGPDLGHPVSAIVSYVQYVLSKGMEVRVVTARVSPQTHNGCPISVEQQRTEIQEWCLKHIGRVLPVTCAKDYGMIELIDDRAIQVEFNTGRRADCKPW